MSKKISHYLVLLAVSGCGSSSPVPPGMGSGTATGVETSDEGACVEGHEACPCASDGECLADLVCLSDVCVDVGGDESASTGSTATGESTTGESSATETAASTEATGDGDGDEDGVDDGGSCDAGAKDACVSEADGGLVACQSPCSDFIPNDMCEFHYCVNDCVVSASLAVQSCWEVHCPNQPGPADQQACVADCAEDALYCYDDLSCDLDSCGSQQSACDAAC